MKSVSKILIGLTAVAGLIGAVFGMSNSMPRKTQKRYKLAVLEKAMWSRQFRLMAP